MPRLAAVLLFACLAVAAAPASPWDRGEVETFATLPAGAGLPEGLTIDAAGNLYVTTFDTGRMLVFDRHGSLLRDLQVAQALLGLAFHPSTGELLVLDYGNSKILRVNPATGASSVFATMPAGQGLNALTFDGSGNVYVSASFTGIIWRVGPHGGTPLVWSKDPLLSTTGFPPFGANGVEFNKAQNTLFVCNTGDDRLLSIPVKADGSAGAVSVFSNSINGCDGIYIDGADNIWAAANQSDELVVVDPTGKVIAKLGDFTGVDAAGAPTGLLFPASPARYGEWMYVTNLSLDTRAAVGQQAVDSQWAAKVKTPTVARLRARIPRLDR